MNQAILLWLTSCLAAGLTLGGIRAQNLRAAAGRASISAAMLPAVLIFDWVLLSDDNNSIYLIMLAVLSFIAFLLSMILAFLFTIAAEPLTEMLRKILSFGPDSFDRMNKILVTLTVVIASFLALSKYNIHGLPGYLSADSAPSDEKIKSAQTECKKFILEKAANDYRDETHVFDAYLKNGKIVVEIGYRDKDQYRRHGDDSYSVRICVYDEEQGTIMLPSPFNMNDWRK